MWLQAIAGTASELANPAMRHNSKATWSLQPIQPQACSAHKICMQYTCGGAHHALITCARCSTGMWRHAPVCVLLHTCTCARIIHCTRACTWARRSLPGAVRTCAPLPCAPVQKSVLRGLLPFPGCPAPTAVAPLPRLPPMHCRAKACCRALRQGISRAPSLSTGPRCSRGGRPGRRGRP